MISRIAVAGYRSLRDVTLAPGRLTVVTGANGSGKSSLYRGLRLLAETAQGRLIGSLALEGGLASTLWAGPEKIGRDMRSGRYPVQGTVRSAPISLRLGFTGDDFGYAIDLGLPADGGLFPHDPEIKVEAMWSGGILGRANLHAERRGPTVRLRRLDGAWRNSMTNLPAFDSMVTHCADPDDGLELLLMRERMRDWRFYDMLRTDPEAPARRLRPLTYTPVLAGDGADLAAAIATIGAIGDGEALATTIDDAFPGASVAINASGLTMTQPGLLRSLAVSELSDGTLRYLLLVAALLSPRPPELMILNEPEVSLHPTLLEPLARLLQRASQQCQIIVISHSDILVAALLEDPDSVEIVLEKEYGETRILTGPDAHPRWIWPVR